jgi:hypothetical protein
MIKLALPAFVMTLLIAASAIAGSNADHKVAIHVALHESRTCNSGLPDLRSCKDIAYTFDGCTDVDVFPIFYDLAGVTAIQLGLSWPVSWGSCAFTACGFDFVIGEIVDPEDGMAGTWNDCRYVSRVIVGYGWLGPLSAGIVCPVPNRTTGRIGVTDCDYSEDEPAGIYCGGACGKMGDDPCGGDFSEDKTWGNIKAMFR